MTETHPALSQIEAEFDKHMRRFREGIKTSEDFVYWLQRTVVLTLGQVDNDTLIKLFLDPAITSMILLDQPVRKAQRRNPEEQPLEKPSDRRVREKIEGSVFTPAFRAAYADLKTHANEYIDEDGSVNLNDGSPPALRPSIANLATRQRRVLDDLLEESGFDSDGDLSSWSRDLVAATRGRYPDERIKLIMGKDPALYSCLRGSLVEDRQTRKNFLQWFAVKFILPEFNTAVRDLAQTAGEKADDGTGSSNDTLNV